MTATWNLSPTWFALGLAAGTVAGLLTLRRNSP